MAHLKTIRYCTSFVSGKDLILGTDQELDKEISYRKYRYNNVRKGYTMPSISTFMLKDYRVKKEAIPFIVRDLGCIVLNPTPNDMTLRKVFFSPVGDFRSVGKRLKFIIWVFKWVNKKKTTASILFVLGLVTWQLWLWVIALIVLTQHYKPVPIAAKGKRKPFFEGHWYYEIAWGVVEDPAMPMITKTKVEDHL